MGKTNCKCVQCNELLDTLRFFYLHLQLIVVKNLQCCMLSAPFLKVLRRLYEQTDSFQNVCCTKCKGFKFNLNSIFN